MDILLIQDVDKLGRRGDRVKVKSGYARNYLLPFGYAVLPTHANLAAVDRSRAKWLAEETQKVESARVFADMIKALTLNLMERASDEGRLYGSVNDKSIAAKLAEMGYKVDVKAIRLDAPIREIGNYDVRVHLHAEVEFFLPVRIRAEGFETWEPGQPKMRKVGGA